MNNPDRPLDTDIADTLAREVPCDPDVPVGESLSGIEQALAEVYRAVESLPAGPDKEPFYAIFYGFYTALHCRAEELLNLEIRRAEQGLGFDPSKGVVPIRALDKSRTDFILENALQRSDFRAIRAVLNYEGYGIPVKEPNNLIIPAEWDNEESNVFDDLEIQITPEEYEMWKAPLEPFETEPSDEESALQKAFAETMAESLPFRLERLIRQRDVVTLRMMLRLYGHDISPNQHGYQEDSLDEPPSQGNLHGTAPEPSKNS